MRTYITIGTIIGIVSSVFAYLVVISFWDDSKEFSPTGFNSFVKDILGPIASGFGGAIAGALASFKVQQDASFRKELQLEVRDYNRALHGLAGKLNMLGSYKRAIVVPHENNPLRFCTMPGLALGESDYGSSADILLTPILLSLEEADLLSSVSESEAFFASVVDSVRARNNLLEKHRDKMEQHEKGRRREISLGDLASIQGTGSLVRLYSFSEDFIKLLDETIERLGSTIDKLEAQCIPKLKNRGIKIMSLKKMKDVMFIPTAPPAFKSVDDFVAIIENQEPYGRLADRKWKPLPRYGV
ncbi:hypothetical protein [Pseudomonas sp. PDM19]|uniref:hypothetical protein n=1 Tax=Pseudomonas sp. PDM19 TaxID=2769272 RepID=UPI001782F34B|nr:hypothetical protein [Pseudomonas sp. PDM19]MBD9630735.1 hypothetical protein [Pseudomonas sp. PDM19]